MCGPYCGAEEKLKRKRKEDEELIQRAFCYQSMCGDIGTIQINRNHQTGEVKREVRKG